MSADLPCPDATIPLIGNPKGDAWKSNRWIMYEATLMKWETHLVLDDIPYDKVEVLLSLSLLKLLIVNLIVVRWLHVLSSIFR